MADLQFPLSDYEMNQIKGIEEYMKTSPTVLQFEDDDYSAYFDILQAMKQRGVIRDIGIDNCDAFLITGSFEEFKKWIESQNEKAKRDSMQQGGIQMSFEPLTKNCEKLLSEILEHRDAEGNCDLSYWKQRFEDLGFAEENLLRSQFGILHDREMISVQWASDVPYILLVLEEGSSYFEQKEYVSQLNRNLIKEKNIRNQKEYDVFISHANRDKLDYVDELFVAIRKLGIKVFYDTEEISWGDNWKQVILDGTAKSEFAIIVISKNFFGREWTERELDEFLKRQNASGQKIVLPLLYNTTVEEMKEKYPKLGEIQALETDTHTKEEIVIFFARELIKRLR